MGCGSSSESGSLFRSEEMALCQLFLQSEAAYPCVSELGELGVVQFRDLNPEVNAFQRKFVNEVRRCDEMERRLRYFEKETRKAGIQIWAPADYPDAPQPRDMANLEITIEKLENELREVNQNADALKKSFLELTELKHVLQKTQVFFEEQEIKHTSSDSTTRLIDEENLKQHNPVQLGFVAGVITRDKIPGFEKMLWRACRGNVFLRLAEIEKPLEDPSTGEQVYKSVFIIFFQGEQLKSRVKKICDGFRATQYPCPEAPAARREIAIGVMTRIEDLNKVLGQTEEHRRRVLAAASKNLKNWFIKIRKIKAIYHTLNQFNLDVTQKCLIAECWVPVLDLEKIQQALQTGTKRTGSSVPPILERMETSEVPPTYNRTNKFTRGFEALIDSYGVATYREINPTPYTCITFPFLFAVMFGDLGHGALMTGFSAWMVLKEKPLSANKTDNEIWNIFFGGRYIILLMGIFSMYTGLMYNDIFSKSINLFGSHWTTNYNGSTILSNPSLQLDPATSDYEGTPYPIGMDPIWQLADNKIVFLNAYKMKMSIILGVLHMLFGVCLSLVNHRYFKNKIDIFCLFIPQLVFLMFLFLYMVLLMFLKWLIYSPKSSDVKKGPHCAPSILIMFINMVLFKPGEPSAVCDEFMYAGQGTIQKALVLIALVCIPWMLLAKPLLIMREHKKRNKLLVNDVDGKHAGDGSNTVGKNDEKNGEEHENMGEIFIHQGIHTIEYVLGSVSHTASYLRLWALSLAHAQLSEVLWNMVLSNAFKFIPTMSYGAGIVVFFIFGFWAVLTVGILVLMEGLSAFLHTLRLHWVEFQSKFYDGLGYVFTPFSFKVILEQAARQTEE